jgi:hypothetical protein
MLKQFAPKERMPPSPKSRAWMRRAMVIEIQAAWGPRRAARRVPPTACPVVPPGRGTLNIIRRKEKEYMVNIMLYLFVYRIRLLM